MPGPTGSSAKSCGKHNFVTSTTTCAGCQRYPGECAKCVWGVPGRGDAVFGTEGLPGQVMGLARVWGHFAAPSAMLPSSLGAPQSRNWQHKIISARLGKTLVSSFPLSLHKATIRAALTNCCSQLMFLLRKFSEVLMIYSLRSVNSEHIQINSYVKLCVSPVQFPWCQFSGSEGSGCSNLNLASPRSPLNHILK